MANKLPLISVVICSLNGADVIKDALNAIKRQKWAGKLEIIVVDDGSIDDTYKIAKSFKDVKVIKNKINLGTSKSRNIGIKAAKGEIIAFTDDDCRPRPTWIKELHAGYTRDEIKGVGGDIITNDKSSLTLRYLSVNQINKPLENKLLKSMSPFYRFWSYLKKLMGLNQSIPNRKRSVYSLATANVSFRKYVLQEINMFDERFAFAGEDVDLCKRLNQVYPKSLWYAPKAKVVHRFDRRLSDTLRRSKAYGVGNAQLLRKHKDFLPPIYPFPILILLSFLFGFINLWFLLTPLLLVIVIYSVGIRTALKNRSLEPFLYGYIQYLQELYGNIGFIKGWQKFRKTFNRTEDSKLNHVPLESTRQDIDDSFSSKAFNFSIRASCDIIEKQPEKNNKFKLESGLIASILGLVLLATLLKSSTIFHVPTAITIVILSGYLILRGFRVENNRRLPGMLRLAIMTSLGIAWIMFFGLIADVLLPVFGLKRPLTSDWLPLIFVLATGLLIPWALKYKIAIKKRSNLTRNKDTLFLASVLILMILFSFCGARLLNNGYSNILIMSAFGLGLISIVFTIIRQKHLPENILPIVLFVLSLCGVWSYSLRSNYVFGWDIQNEFKVFQTTLNSGNWILGAKHGAYDAMLSLSILPVVIAKVTGLAGLTIFKFLSPLLFSFVPVILYYIYRIFTKRWTSFLAALITIAQFYYMQQFSALVRQQIAFLFYATILYLILQNKLSNKSKNYLLLASIFGLVVSHYSTTYLAIIFFGGTYITSKIIFALLQRYKPTQAKPKYKYINGWMVLILILSALIWYGPATHSSGYLEKLSQKNGYSYVIQKIGSVISQQFNNHQSIPKSTKIYLKTIGTQFQNSHKNFHYYPGASNNTVSPVAQATIHSKWPILKTLLNGASVVLNYGWWILGSAGILALAISTYRKLDYRKIELVILGAIGILGFITIHLSSTFQNLYNETRLDEQVLMFVAMPFILMVIWLLHNLPVRLIKFTATSIVLLSFAIASGIITQVIGGLPPANLNNIGQDYNNFYIQQSDIASAHWLGDRYTSNSIVFADNYSSLRLTAAKKQIFNQFNDVTPQTISIGSFVYADYTNIKNGLVDKQISNKQFSYQFPTSFLQQNKNLVYSNGNAEVFK